MMSLIIVVLAIVLSAILIVGGANYLDVGGVSKIIAGSGFRTGKDTLLVAVSSFKMTHNGQLPSKADFFNDISKYVARGEFSPRMPPGADDFKWFAAELPDGRAAICLENKTKTTAINAVVLDNVISFAKREAAQSRENDVYLASGCTDKAGTSDPKTMSRDTISGDASVSVSFALE
jgi:hypothetical protein